MNRIYNTCVHITDYHYGMVVDFIESKNMYYIYKRLKANKQKPNSITVYGTLQQLEEFQKLIQRIE